MVAPGIRGDQVPAATAPEITTALSIKRGVESFLDIAQQEHAELSRKELYRIASRHSSSTRIETPMKS
jgi:hypothetical protein